MDAMKDSTALVDDKVSESGNTGCLCSVEKRFDAQYGAVLMNLDARRKSAWNNVDIARQSCPMVFVISRQFLISRSFEECRITEY
jgi:hypothetical protein